MRPWRILLPAALAALLAGCLADLLPRPVGRANEQACAGIPGSAVLVRADALAAQKRFRAARREAERILAQAPDQDAAAEARFRLLMLLADGDNPDRDYAKARSAARAFLKRYPGSPRAPAVRVLLSLLQEVRRAQAEISTLKGYNAIQEEKIERLEEDIRRIKEIDLKVEEQKKKLE